MSPLTISTLAKTEWGLLGEGGVSSANWAVHFFMLSFVLTLRKFILIFSVATFEPPIYFEEAIWLVFLSIALNQSSICFGLRGT